MTAATPRFVVVVGTDTGVGKTLVTCALAHALRAEGKRVLAIKPIETGIGPGDDAGTDGAELARASGQEKPRAALVRLRDPLTPALAAEREGVTIDVDALADEIRELGQGYDVVLVECAGGVLSPLSWTHDATTLAHRLKEDYVLLVGSDRLGTISLIHTAVQCLLDTWLHATAIVLSAPATPDASTGTNAGVLRRRLAHYGGAHERIVEVPRVASPEDAAGSLADVVRWLAAARTLPAAV